MGHLAFRVLTSDSSSLDKLDRVFAEAFPPEEVNIPFKEYVALSERNGDIHALEIVDGDKPIGFFLYVDADGYSYLNYFAVDASERGQGYGQRALTLLLDSFGERPLVADIERPIEGKDGYDIKLRRQKFYERNGFLVSDEAFSWDGAEYLVISNKPDYLDSEFIFRLKDAAAGLQE